MKTINDEQWKKKKLAEKMGQISCYLQKGWAVFPVNTHKAPMTRNGCLDASTYPEVVRRWWEAYPTANVAIATGRKSNLVVIDVDIKNGKDGLESLVDAYGDPIDIDDEQQLIAQTPSGGLHLYYQWDERFPVTVATNVLPGVDIRGERGYVLAPPSGYYIGNTWHRYRWCDSQLPVPKAEGWVLDLLEKSFAPKAFGAMPGNAVQGSKLNIRQMLTGIPQGQRDDQLFRYTCHLRECGIDYDLAVGFIRAAAARCEPPFPDAIAISKVDRAYSALELNFPLSNEE